MNATASATPSPKLAALRAYADAGYTLIPVCSPTVAHEHLHNGKMRTCGPKGMGKIPPRHDWSDTAPGQYAPEELEKGNYGVALRAGDLVVDIDPRNFATGDHPVKRLTALVGPLLSFTVRTGGGGLHIYFRKPADLIISQGLRDFPGIEFKTAGRQVVGPGSLHAIARKHYEIASGAPAEVAEAPAKLLELLKRTEVPFSDIGGTGAYINDAQTQGRFLSYLQDVAETSIEGKGGDNNAFKVACHGRDLGLPPATTWELMLSDWNERCTPPWDAEELKAKVINAYKFAKSPVGSAHPAANFDVVEEIKKPIEPVKEEERAWDLGPHDRVLKTFHNLMLYMKQPAGGLNKIFAYNELSGRNEFVTPAPWHRGRMPRTPGVDDSDLKLLKGYLSTRHGFEASVQNIEEAVTNVAYHERFHPVKAYLESLKWDGVPRLDTWMRDYLGAIDGGHPDYLRAVSRKVLCAAVMRVMRPGIKFDHVPVLEGTQDLGKSAVCEILGGKWASDAPVDPHSRDTVDAMQGRWIIEIAEMEVLRKTDEDALKAFITRKTDRVRLAYGRTTGEFPRQSIFIATKNPRADGTYLKDDTGNRRWWPVRCEPPADETGLAQIDFKGLTEARNQLFAEAMHVCKTTGEKLYMETAALKRAAAAVVAERHAEHEWTERVASWIAELDQKAETRRDFLTVRDVFIDCMAGADTRLDRKNTVAIAGILRDLGWTQGFKRHQGRFQRGWYRVAPDVAPSSTIDALLAEL